MIDLLNHLVDQIERRLTDHLDVDELASGHGTTGYHTRRMFAALAGMPISEYIRRRRMTVAAADLIGDDDLLTIAVRYGYSSTEAFGRAFRSVHGVSHGSVRRDGGPLRSQPQLRFRLTVEGSTPMDARITDRPDFRLVGHATRVPLIREGINPHIQRHIASLPATEHDRLKRLGDTPNGLTEPAGLLQVSADVDADYTPGSELTYLHGVAVTLDADVPADLDTIDVAAGTWVVFRTVGAYPTALQAAYAASAAEWFPSNPCACDQDRRWSRCSTGRQTSAQPPATSGSRSSACDVPSDPSRSLVCGKPLLHGVSRLSRVSHRAARPR